MERALPIQACRGNVLVVAGVFAALACSHPAEPPVEEQAPSIPSGHIDVFVRSVPATAEESSGAGERYCLEGTASPPLTSGMLTLLYDVHQTVNEREPVIWDAIQGTAFRSQPVDAGLYTVFVRGAETGWSRALIAMGSRDRETGECTLRLSFEPWSSWITGVVLDEAGAPVAGASVSYSEGDFSAYDMAWSYDWTSATNADGRFGFFATRAESELQVERDGFRDWTAQVAPGAALRITLARR